MSDRFQVSTILIRLQTSCTFENQQLIFLVRTENETSVIDTRSHRTETLKWYKVLINLHMAMHVGNNSYRKRDGGHQVEIMLKSWSLTRALVTMRAAVWGSLDREFELRPLGMGSLCLVQEPPLTSCCLPFVHLLLLNSRMLLLVEYKDSFAAVASALHVQILIIS